MSLATIQRDLAALYETPLEHSVLDFLVTDPDLARRLHDSEVCDLSFMSDEDFHLPAHLSTTTNSLSYVKSPKQVRTSAKESL